MKPQHKILPVRCNVEIAENVYKLAIQHDCNSSLMKIKPGQFYMLRSWNREPLLSRPISVSSYDGNSISFLYAVSGKGTELFSTLKSGDNIELFGPLGNGFNTDEIRGRIAVVAGGIGIAPMMQLVKELSSSCDVDLYAGFRSEVYGIEDMKGYVKGVFISTEDGSTGTKGYVTELLEVEKYDMVLCCGPEVMMMKVAAQCSEKDIPVLLSMEKHMACGVGACLVCTCKTKYGNKRSCKEGPVFWGKDLVIE
jgi:dihydroorotate dehydrogenase electron transfer subunit